MNLAKFEAVLFKAFAAGFVSLVVGAGVTQFKQSPAETVQLDPVVVTAAAAGSNS